MTMPRNARVKPVSAAVGLLFLANAAAAQYTQQGAKLVGSGGVGSPQQGTGVSISADGNTVVVGGPFDNAIAGAAWIFVRSGGVWTQQGTKLVGSGVANAVQGVGVAISGDGNTVAVGGPGDTGSTGAICIFTRSGGVWTQQGAKLTASDTSGSAALGTSLALSGDGNTLITGGPGDASSAGAAWIFVRSAGVWSQQGSKVVGSGATGSAHQGVSVSLSTDGNTAVVGGEKDNSDLGAAWVFTRSGTTWTQQGAKLVGTGSSGAIVQQGHAVAVSGDGNTAMVGGWVDNSGAGAVWVFVRSAGVWGQQGAKLVGTGAVNAAIQGASVSVSADGNAGIVGGPDDGVAGLGASWVFTRSGGVWSQLGSKLVGSGGFLSGQGPSVAISSDASTAIVGGPTDGSQLGAAWIFVAGASGATHLAFAQQPAADVAGQAIAPSVTVQLEDAGNAPVAQAGTPVTLALASGTGTLSGTTTQVTDASGLATFPGLSVNLAGTKTLSAASGALGAATSSSFIVSPAAAATLAISGGNPQHAPISTAFGLPLLATVTDAFGNAVPGVLVTFTAPGSGASAVVSGSPAMTNAGGVASVTASANGTAGSYVVTASAAALAPVTFALTNDPSGAPAPSNVPAIGTAGLVFLGLALAAVALRSVGR